MISVLLKPSIGKIFSFYCLFLTIYLFGFLGGGVVKESTCQCWRHGFDPWVRRISCRRKWQPTPVFFPGQSHGQRSLAGYNPWGHKESDRTEHICLFYFGQDAWHVPWPGIEPEPPALKGWSLNHWRSREVLHCLSRLSANEIVKYLSSIFGLHSLAMYIHP